MENTLRDVKWLQGVSVRIDCASGCKWTIWSPLPVGWKHPLFQGRPAWWKKIQTGDWIWATYGKHVSKCSKDSTLISWHFRTSWFSWKMLTHIPAELVKDRSWWKHLLRGIPPTPALTMPILLLFSEKKLLESLPTEMKGWFRIGGIKMIFHSGFNFQNYHMPEYESNTFK